MEEQKNSFNPLLIIGGILIALLVLGGGFLVLNQNKTTEQTSNQLQTTPTQTVTESPDGGTATVGDEEADVKEFEITNKGLSFSPNEIRVKQGDKLRITFTNSGGTHDWVVDEFDARTKIVQTGESDTIAFVVDKKGTFEFYCSLMDHRAKGMVGKLIVE